MVDLSKSYLKTLNDQDEVIRDLSQKVAELEDEIRKRPPPLIPEFCGILYRMNEYCMDEAIYQCSDEEAKELELEFIERQTITLKRDFGNMEEIISPALVARVRVQKPLRKSEIRANGVTVEGEQ